MIIMNVLLFALVATMVVALIDARRKLRCQEVAQAPSGTLLAAMDRLNSVIDGEHAQDKPENLVVFCLQSIMNEFPGGDALIMSRYSADEHDNRYLVLDSRGDGPMGRLEVGAMLEPFESQVHKHFFWSKQTQLIQGGALVDCIPKEYAGKYDSALAGVFDIGGRESVAMSLRRLGGGAHSSEGKQRFESIFRAVKAGFAIVNLRAGEAALREAVDRAHEEGMLQISTGIIHNIGNGIVVIKIALDRIGNFKPFNELVDFLKDELLAGIKLAPDGQAAKVSEEYLRAAREVADKLASMLSELDSEFKQINVKFQSVIETISLQQQFIGELGTENVDPFRMIVNDVLKMSEPTLADSQIELRSNITSQASVLVDAALLRQVLLTLLKCSVGSINKARRSPAVVKVVCDDRKGEAGEIAFARMEIKDNGYGVTFDPPPPGTSKNSPAMQQYRELAFCKGKVEKYGGNLRIDSLPGSGSTIEMELPAYKGGR